MRRVTKCGYDVDSAEELARVTALFTSVGDNMSADDASSYLISTLQGYQMAADEAEDIVDKYNKVANNFAIDTRGIGEALQRSAASFNASNTDLSKSIALITATNEVVQNPESVGTLWKTMSARIRGAKTELEELGEEEDEFTNTTSKLQNLVKSLTGFDILEEDGKTFKDIYEIILGIGKEWDKLSDIEQASLGEALAGKRNANALFAVLGNLDTLQDAYAAAETAAGSAAKEQENYAQSVQYSIDRLSASLEELAYDFLDSGLLKNAAEFANTLVQGLDSIIDKTGSFTYALNGALAVLLSIKKMGLNFSYDSKKGFGVSLFGQEIAPDKELVQLKEFGKLIDSGVDSTFAYKKALSGCSEETKKYVDECIKGNKSTKEMISGFKQGAKDGSAFSNTLKSIAASAASLLANLAISAAISTVINAISALATAEDDLAEKTKTLSDEYITAKEDINGYKEKIEGLRETIEDENSSYEDSKTARENLLKIQDELIRKYGSEKGAIDNITDAINGQIDALDRLRQAKWRETLNKLEEPEEGMFGGFKQWYTTKAQGYDSVLERVLDYSSNVSSEKLNGTLFEATEEELELLKEAISAIDGISVEDTGLTKDGVRRAIRLTGEDLGDYYQALLNVQDVVKELGGSDELNDYLRETATNAEKFNSKYGSFVDEYVANEVIGKSLDYSEKVDTITKAVEKYNKAFAEGFKDESEKEAAVKDLADVYNKAIGQIDDAQVVGYINRLYPTIQSTIKDWNFTEDLLGNADGIRDTIRDALELFKDASYDYLSYDDLINYDNLYKSGNYDAEDDRADAYRKLQKAAQLYGLEVSDLIEILKRENEVLTDSRIKLDELYGKENIDTLSPEDLEVASQFADMGLDSFDALLKKIDEYKESLKESEEETNNWSNELNTALEKLGLIKDTNDGKEYDESWTNYLETIKQLNPELANNEEELEKCALANMQFSHAVDDLSKNFETYKEALKDADALTPEFSDAINALADDLTYLTGINFSIDDASKFLAEAENLQLLEQAINGSDEALQKLQAHAAEAVKIHVDVSELEQLQEYTEVRIALNLDAESFNSQLQGFADWLAANENMGSIDVTALLDEFPFLAQLDDLMRESSAVAQAVKKIFDSLGWDVKWTTRKVPVATGSKIQSIYAPQEVRSKYSNAGSGAIRYDDVLVPDNFHYVPNGGRSGSKTSTSAYTPKSFSPSQKSNAASNINKANSGGGGSDSDKEDDYKETIDYFERLIKVLDQSINLLKAHLEDVVGSFAKNTLIDAQEAQIKKKMEGYSSAIAMYSAKASEALSKIPSDVAANIQNGAVAIGEFVGESNKEVVEAAQEYEGWADKVAECKQQIVELREELRQLELQKFKNVAQDFQELFDVRKTQIDLISKAISLFETARDKKVGRAFYDESIEQTEKQLNSLLEKRTALTNQMSSAIASGIEVANEEWFKYFRPLIQQCI